MTIEEMANAARGMPARPGRGAPTVLALECAGGACSAALWHCGTLAGHRFLPMARGHAEALVPMATAVVAEAGLRFDDLDLVAVTVGPGAFTGLRIGLAAARGIALATGLPVFGVTTFAVLAESVPAAERAGRRLLALLDTKRGDLFAQLFDGDDLTPLGAPAVLSVDALDAWVPPGPLLAAGDGLSLAAPVLDRRPDTICVAGDGPALDAAIVARIAARQFLADPEGGLPAVPLYLRPPAVTLPGGEGSSAPAA